MDDLKQTKLEAGQGNQIDAPMFDPIDWKLSDFEARLCRETRELASDRFADRAPGIDREARFPTENYADLHKHDLMGICVPSEYEIGRASCRERV